MIARIFFASCVPENRSSSGFQFLDVLRLFRNLGGKLLVLEHMQQRQLPLLSNQSLSGLARFPEFTVNPSVFIADLPQQSEIAQSFFSTFPDMRKLIAEDHHVRAQLFKRIGK